MMILSNYCIGKKCSKLDICTYAYSPCPWNSENLIIKRKIIPPRGGTGTRQVIFEKNGVVRNE